MEMMIPENIADKYPLGVTPHEIAIQAVGADDVAAIGELVDIALCEYMPIRWDALIPLCSAVMLGLIEPLLTEMGRIEAAYRTHDPAILSTLSEPDVSLAVKYGYTPHIPTDDIDAVVKGYPTHDLNVMINNMNYVLVLQKALQYERTDTIRYILDEYTVERGDPILLYPYLDMFLPRITMLYLFDHNYMSDKKGSLLEGIVRDDPTITNDRILSASDISIVYEYDAINVFHAYGIEPHVGMPLQGCIHGSILHHIMLHGNDAVVSEIAPMASPKDISAALTERGDKRIMNILIPIAANKGWFEIIDRFVPGNIAWVIGHISHPVSEAMEEYLNHRLHNSGRYINDLFNGNEGINIPPEFIRKILPYIFIAGNDTLLAKIVPIFPLTDDMRVKAYKISLRYHGMDEGKLNRLLAFIQ